MTASPQLQPPKAGPDIGIRRTGRSVAVHQVTPDEEQLMRAITAGAITRLPARYQGNADMESLFAAILPNVEKRVAYVYDRSLHRMVGGAEEIAELYGYTINEIRSHKAGWMSVVHPDDVAHVLEVESELASGQVNSATVQTRVACKDGRWEWVQNDWRALSHDADGRLVRAVGMVQVITHLALATQALCNEAALNALCRMLVEEWVEGIFLLDNELRIVYANEGGLESLGYTQQELHGRGLDVLLKYESGRRTLRLLPKSGQKIVQRALHVRSDGSSFPVEVTLRKISEERVLLTSRDITEQQRAEEESRRQTAYYKGLFLNNPSGVAVFDESFHITQSNPALRRMVGYTERHLAGMKLVDLMEPSSREQVRDWAVDAMRTPIDTELVLRRRDGRRLYTHAAVTVMANRPDEKSFRGIIILTDISARKQAEEELARQSELSDKLLSESAAMIGMMDHEGRLIKVNSAVERVSGYAAKDLVGRLMWESGLLDQEEIPRARARMAELTAGAPRVTALSRTRTKSGDLRILQVHNTTTRRPDGSIENFIITAVDVTEQQRLQRHLMDVVEQEQARIGHDLHDGVGQMLTGIGTLTEALQSSLTGSAKTSAGRIHSLVKQAIQQVRQLSRTLSPAALQNRDLAAALEMLAENVRCNCNRRCECMLDPEIQVTDNVQATHLYRLAQEAVNNAIRHGDASVIHISLRRESAQVAILEIMNNGAPFESRALAEAEGIGVRGMHYRASLIRADLSLECPPEGGVRVSCRFPFPQAEGKKSPRTKTT